LIFFCTYLIITIYVLQTRNPSIWNGDEDIFDERSATNDLSLTTSQDANVCVYRGTTFTFDSKELPHEIKEFPPFIYYYSKLNRKEILKSNGIEASVGTRVQIRRYSAHAMMLLYAGMWKFDESGARLLAM